MTWPSSTSTSESRLGAVRRTTSGPAENLGGRTFLSLVFQYKLTARNSAAAWASPTNPMAARPRQERVIGGACRGAASPTDAKGFSGRERGVVTGPEWSRRAVTDDQIRSHDSVGGSTGRVASHRRLNLAACSAQRAQASHSARWCASPRSSRSSLGRFNSRMTSSHCIVGLPLRSGRALHVLPPSASGPRRSPNDFVLIQFRPFSFSQSRFCCNFSRAALMRLMTVPIGIACVSAISL